MGSAACSSEENRLGQGGNPIDASDAGDAALGPNDMLNLDSGADPALSKCLPEVGGPYALLEGESVEAKLRCGSGRAAAGALVVEGLPAGASYDSASATLRWTPTLSQAATYELTVRATESNETAILKIGVVDAWENPANVPLADASKYTEEYGQPVLHLQTTSNINSDAYTPASVTYKGHTFTGAEVQTRGTFSASFPKRSYTLKFTKTDKFSDPRSAGGFNNKRKIVLVSPFNDNSYLRSRLGFDLWNKLDPENHIRVQSYSAVVYLNGSYHGVYTVVDHIDEYLMEDFGLRQEGNLYKARQHDANFRTTGERDDAKTSLHQGYSKEEGLPLDGEPGAYDDLDALVSFVATSSNAQFLAELDQRIVRKDYEDWFIFVNFLMAGDSIGKNSYHYHDPALPTNRWRYIPWDLDESFGQDYRSIRAGARSQSPEQGRYIEYNNLFERMLAQPTIGVALRQRFGATLRGAFERDGVLAMLDAMATEIEKSALRDEKKWGSAYRSFGPWDDRTDHLTHKEEVAYVRQWIIDRHAYLDMIY